MALRETLNANFKQLQEENKVNNGYLTGEISTEKKMVQQVKEMKHSTFDRSKFEVVGSPTITDDGIASGFGSATVLRYIGSVRKSNILINNSLKIQGTFKMPATDMGNYYRIIYELYNNDISASSYMLAIDGNRKIVFRASVGALQGLNFTAEFDKEYEYIFENSNGTSIGKIREIGSEIWHSTNAITEELSAQIVDLTIGARKVTTYNYHTGSIDLKQFSITVDGVEVFNGNKTGVDQITDTLQIPYTLSKTGSKIVDATYRDRVQDMYEQFGYANYYTLSDTDVTLPMGEIYGMFGNNFTNNPYSLLVCKWSDHEIKNLSWLRSQGQWNNGNVYKSVYDLLVDIQVGRKTIAGVSVKLSTATYTDYDFVINTSNTTFRLPTKTKLASGSGVVGNGMSIGITQGNNTYRTIASFQNGNDALFTGSGYGAPQGTYANAQSGLIAGSTFGLTPDSSKSGIETDSTGLYLYYYVGETVQNANLIDVQHVLDSLVEVPVIIKTFVDGTSGYRIWSDGYCEQWGITSLATENTVSLTKTFLNNNYLVILTPDRDTQSACCAYNWEKTTNSFKCASEFNGGLISSRKSWKASGYLAEGQY